MRLLINYASAAFRASQRLNATSAMEVGGFDRVASFGPNYIDREFASRHRQILRTRKGSGLWLWKPYVVCQSLLMLRDGDYLFYSDAGARFVAPIDPLVATMDREGLDLMPFELPFKECEWTKRDAFVALRCDHERYTETKQRLASFFLVRKTQAMQRFFEEYLSYAADIRILGDADNTLGLPNYPGFREHRHDQSIFSLLTKLHGYEAFRDPSQWGNTLYGEYRSSTYGQLLEHTRRRTHSLLGLLWNRFNSPPGAVDRPPDAELPVAD